MRVEDLTGRVLVDTNVLIYSTLTSDPGHELACQAMRLRYHPEVDLFISV